MKLLRYFNKCGGTILKNYYGFIKKHGRHPEKYPFDVRYNKLRNLLINLTDKLGVHLYVNGSENIATDKKVFYAPNHQSAYDPLCCMALISQNTSFVAKAELKKVPYVNYAIKSIDGEFMDRDNLRESLKIMKRVTQSICDQEKSWLIFPEGTRTHDENHDMGEFKHGTFKIALNSKCDIVPVALWGLWRIFSKKDKMKNYPVQVSFLPAIPYEEYKDLNSTELAKLVENRVREEIENLKNKDFDLLKALNPKYKFKEGKVKLA